MIVGARSLQPWEVTDQLTTWAPDATYAAERVLECGQACQVMSFRHCAGVWVPAAYLHDQAHPAGAVSGTTLDDMVGVYQRNETHAQTYYPTTEVDVGRLITESIAVGWHLVALRWFDHPGNTDASGDPILHFTCVTGFNPATYQQAGPWSGTMFTEDHAQFMRMYYGGLIQVCRVRKLGDHRP